MRIVYIKKKIEMQKQILDNQIIYLILILRKKKDLKKSNLMENFQVNIIKIFIIEVCYLIKLSKKLNHKKNMKEIKIKIILNFLLGRIPMKEFIKKLIELVKLMFKSFVKMLKLDTLLNIKNQHQNLDRLQLIN